MRNQKRQEIEFFGTKSGNTNSIAVGYATETNNYGEVAVGVLNKSTMGSKPNSPEGVVCDPNATLFSIGNGDKNGRKNAFEVKGNGSVLISTQGEPLDVAQKINEIFEIADGIQLVKSSQSDLQYTLMVDGQERGQINIPKDQFLNSVTYDDVNKKLIFVFETTEGEKTVEISIADLVDVYTNGEGLLLDDNTFSVDFTKVASVDAVSKAVAIEKTRAEEKEQEIVQSVASNKAAIDAEVSRATQAENGMFKLNTQNNGITSDTGLSIRNGAKLVINSDATSPSITTEIDGNQIYTYMYLKTETVLKKVVPFSLNCYEQVIKYGINDTHTLKLEKLDRLNNTLSNITDATTAEEVVTKFNSLLADLKAKGFMEADA